MLGVLPFVEDPHLSVTAGRATSATLNYHPFAFTTLSLHPQILVSVDVRHK